MPSDVIVGLQEKLSNHMDAILRCFKPGATITVVVRNPKYGDADVVIGNDDLDATIAAIQVMKRRAPTFQQGDTMPKADA